MLPVLQYPQRRLPSVCLSEPQHLSSLGRSHQNLLDHEINPHRHARVKQSATLRQYVHRDVACPETSALGHSRPGCSIKPRCCRVCRRAIFFGSANHGLDSLRNHWQA